MTKIDLHIHSTMSDGLLTPAQIIETAKNNGVETIAISDHDTIAAYNDELFNFAKMNSVQIIPAVEMSTKWHGKGFHILGYNFDLKNKEFQDTLEKVRFSRKKYLLDVGEKLGELNFKLDIESLSKIESVTKANIANDIISNKENEKELIKVFGYIPLKGEFIETLMNEGCKAYVKKESLSSVDAANAIRKAGGKVVLAHPVAYLFEDGTTNDDIQALIDEIKPDGIESNYIYFDRYNNLHDEVDKWTSFAEKNNLFVTIGSDFHAFDGFRPEIGFRNINFDFSNQQTELVIKNLTIKK